MVETLLNWVAARSASSDIIDLDFVESDLVDIQLTENEFCESACFDSFALLTTEEAGTCSSRDIPIGKLVL